MVNPKTGYKIYRKYMRWDAILKRLPIGKKLIGAEIGVLRGDTAYRVLNNRSLITHIMVDPWKVPSPGSTYAGQVKEKNAQKSQADHEKAYQQTVKNTKKFAKRAIIYRMTSIEASKKIDDYSLDYVFIDGDHSYIGCKKDIELWMRKIKPGGWIGGHDYKHESRPDLWGIDKAVTEWFGMYTIEEDYNHTWFVRIPD